MASSEIEIVSASDSNAQQQNPNEEVSVAPVVDVFSASAYGDFDKLRKFVEEDGASLSQPDLNGYYALQWAALNNFPHIAQYIVEVFSQLTHTFPLMHAMCLTLCLYVFCVLNLCSK